MQPKFTPLNYTYKKSNSNVWVLNSDDIPVQKDSIKDQQLVHLAPKSVGGNHIHPRTEWFVAIGDLVLYWIDENGNKQQEPMNPDGKLILIEIPPFLPHAVANRSSEANGILFEMADGKMSEEIEVIVYE